MPAALHAVDEHLYRNGPFVGQVRMAPRRNSKQADIPYSHNVAGKLILLDSTGAAAGVDIATIRNGTPQATMPARKAAFHLVETCDGVTLTAPVDATIGIFLSFEDVSSAPPSRFQRARISPRPTRSRWYFVVPWRPCWAM